MIPLTAKHTKYLVFISILLSCWSFLLKSEIYPFFHWKLYTQPSGSALQMHNPRVYGLTQQRDTVRIKMDNYNTFHVDNYYYYLSGLLNRYNASPEDIEIQEDFLSFARFVHPGYQGYFLVEEEVDILLESQLDGVRQANFLFYVE